MNNGKRIQTQIAMEPPRTPIAGTGEAGTSRKVQATPLQSHPALRDVTRLSILTQMQFKIRNSLTEIPIHNTFFTTKTTIRHY